MVLSIRVVSLGFNSLGRHQNPIAGLSLLGKPLTPELPCLYRITIMHVTAGLFSIVRLHPCRIKLFMQGQIFGMLIVRGDLRNSILRRNGLGFGKVTEHDEQQKINHKNKNQTQQYSSPLQINLWQPLARSFIVYRFQ